VALKILTLVVTSLVFILSSTVVLSKEQEKLADCNQIGRYQVSTTYRNSGNWVFVTIIDTTTGKIVTQERYSGFDVYEKSE